jgi:hypothetical protein
MVEKSDGSMSEQAKLLEQRKTEVLLRKDIAEAEKAIAEANLAKLKAQIPTGETKPIEGKITTDEKSGYFAELAAYSAMVSEAGAIAEKVNSLSLEGEKPCLMIVDSLDFCGPDAELHQVSNQLDFWKRQLEDADKRIQELLKPTKLPLAIMAPLAIGLLSAAADIIGYFRIDYDIKGRDIKLSDTALRSLVAGRIHKYPVHMLAFHRIPTSGIIDTFNKRIEERTNLRSKMAQLQSQRIDPLETNQHKTEEERKELSEAKTAYEQAEAVIKAFDDFNKALVSVPAGRSYSPLASAMVRQYLDHIGITHLLYLAVTSSGGESITSHGLFQCGKVGFLSGCVVTYALADCRGQILAADTLSKALYVKFKLGQNSPPEFEARRHSFRQKVKQVFDHLLGVERK